MSSLIFVHKTGMIALMVMALFAALWFISVFDTDCCTCRCDSVCDGACGCAAYVDVKPIDPFILTFVEKAFPEQHKLDSLHQTLFFHPPQHA